jgi:rare lipoprotein A
VQLQRRRAVAATSACILGYANPAAAQDFVDRWSIIPKAHADPAPEQPAQTTPDSQTQPPSSEKPSVSSSEEHSAAGPTKPAFSGRASFYSYRSAKTANGLSFDRDQMTAAHRSLPFGTKVRVTDVATNRSVVVRIVDRGPYIRGRVLDLSLAAARSLGILERGVVEIHAEVL